MEIYRHYEVRNQESKVMKNLHIKNGRELHTR